MSRTYTLKKRAEQQEQTRRKIVEAAVSLHGTIGPAQTTISMIAEKAGVQRHTFYAHFPDEKSLFMACSALHLEHQPLPDADAWRGIADEGERLRTGLSELYGWYERNAEMAACIMRDAEVLEAVREVSHLRMGPFFAACNEVLGTEMGKRRRAMLRVALSFYTFRTLTRDAGLKPAAAAEAMAKTLLA